MGGYPQWWFYAIVAIAILAETALGLRLWARNRIASVAAIALLVGSGVTLSLVAISSPGSASRAFAILTAIHFAYCLLMHRLARATRRETTQSGIAALYSLAAIGVPVMATRANRADWEQESATAVPASVAALLALAFFVGRAAYRHMMARERQEPSEPAPDMLAITWSIALSTVVASILSVVTVAGQLGFDVKGGRRELTIAADQVCALTGSATLCLVAAGLGWFLRPKTASDDKLRVSTTAVILCSAGLASVAAVLVADLARNPWGWPIIFPYFVVLGVFNALHYLEDIVQTQVRIHCLDGEWPAWLLGLLCSLNIIVAVLWLGERVLWGPGRQGALLLVTAQGIGIVAIVLVTVFAANLVVSFGAGSHQQLSIKSSASNAVQSQLLYGAQLVVTACIPSIAVSMLRRDMLANWKPLFVSAAFAGLMWTVANFAHRNNADHLTSERKRPLSNSVTRRQAPEERRQLQAAFVDRLAGHIAWQEKLSRWTFKVSLLWLFVLAAMLIEWIKGSDEPPAPSVASA